MTAPLTAIGYILPRPPDPLALALREGRLAEVVQAAGLALVRQTGRGLAAPSAQVPLMRSCTPLEALDDLRSGRGIRLIGLVSFNSFGAVLVADGSDIATPADLLGRRIGIPAFDAHPVVARYAVEARRGLAQALVASGLEGLASVIQVELSGYRTVADYRIESAALAAGDVDAVWVAGLSGLRAARVAGVRVLGEVARGSSVTVWARTPALRLLTADESLVERHPDLLRCLVASIHQAGAYAASHPTGCWRHIASGLSASLAEVRQAFGADLPARLVPSLGPAARAALADHVDGLRMIEVAADQLLETAWVGHGFLPDARAATKGQLARMQQGLVTG